MAEIFAEIARRVIGQISTAESNNCALQLLWSWLTVEQRQTLASWNFFRVVGGKSGRTYRIRLDVTTYNVETDLPPINFPPAVVKLCFIPRDMTPWCDKVLAQKLALECNEQEALRVANYSPANMRLDQNGA